MPVARGGAKVHTAQRGQRKYQPSGKRKTNWVKRLADWNTVSATPTPFTKEMREEVAAFLREDNELLGRLLGRDLRSWLATS